MSSLPKFKRLSVDDYLERERDSRIRHEYVEGELFAMAGASRAHNTISLNLAAAFRAHLQGTPCRAYMADMKVRVSARRFYYPDVLVSCQAALEAEDEYYETKPKLIVEVLSGRTERADRGEKRVAYQGIASLEEYVLVDQNKPVVTIYRRMGDDWIAEEYAIGSMVEFRSIGCQLVVNAIYEGAIDAKQ
ncbi:MAG: Uma2 family endonuclease [Gammaproteobacteria bacterium]